MRLVLASGSRWRAQMLRRAGVTFTVRTIPVDEEAVRETLQAEGVSADDAAVALAELKAYRVAAGEADPDCVVLGCDQILDLEGRWMGKAATPDEARANLLALRGRMHRLPTAAVALRGGRRVWHHVAAPKLWVRSFTESFLDHYLEACGETATQTCGGYEYEGLGGQLMTRVDGDYFAILGLPLLPVLQFLRDQGLVES